MILPTKPQLPPPGQRPTRLRFEKDIFQRRPKPPIDPREFGRAVTVCIAARSLDGRHIVAASDWMFSDVEDRIQAHEIAPKMARLSSTWHIMFAGNGELLWPFVNRVKEIISLELNLVHDLKEVESACKTAHQSLLQDLLYDRYFARLGYKNIDEFRRNGLTELGRENFDKYLSYIDECDLGIEFIVYGLDKTQAMHIFSLDGLGRSTNHDVEGFTAIGSGTYMAQAALHRKTYPKELPSLIYRVLDAKFSAETASRPLKKAPASP